MNESKKWYVVYTRRGQEKKVCEALGRKKIESYCPLSSNIHQPGYLRRSLSEALFCNFCFVRISDKQIPELMKTHGVISFVCWLNKPVVIPDDEMDMMREFLYEHRSVRLEKIGVQNGSTLTDNLLIANRDHTFYVQNSTARVTLPSLGYSITAKTESINTITPVQPLLPRLRSIMDKIVG